MLTRFLLKTLVSALVIAGVSELAKRSTLMGAVIAALPLTTLLTVVWLYADTGDTEQVARLCMGILWALIPSLIFILGLPLLLRGGWAFGAAMAISCALTLAGYAVYVYAAGKLA